MDTRLSEHPGWKFCTAEGAELAVLRLGLETTFREKLQWLDDAETLSLRLQGAGKDTDSKRPAAHGGAPR